MARAFAMGIDFGGGGVRALLWDTDSGTSFSEARSCPPRGAPGSAGLGIDLDLDLVFRALCEASRAVIAAADARPEEIVGIAASAMRFGTVVLDADGTALLATPNRDARAAGPAFAMAAEYGEALQAASGIWPIPVCTAARLLWLKSERPELFERAAHVLAINEWIAWRLCGEFRTDPSQAGTTALFGLRERTWNQSWIERLELPGSLFPEVAAPGTVLGPLRSDAAQALGVASGIPISVGAGDTQSSLLGSGCTRPGSIAAIAGSTAPVVQLEGRPPGDPSANPLANPPFANPPLANPPLANPEGRLWIGHHALPDVWMRESNAGPLGESLEWTARVLYGEAKDPVARLLSRADASDVGAYGLLSTLGASVMNARAMGLPIGHLALTHLTRPDDPEPDRHVARSVAEGTAFALRANLAQLETVAGGRGECLQLSGGLSRSPRFAAMLADVVGLPVERAACEEATALGAALCAAVGAGIGNDVALHADSLRKHAQVHEPNPDRHAAYETFYNGWCQARDAEEPARSRAAGHVVPFMLRAVDATAPTAKKVAPRPRILSCADLDAASREALTAIGDFEYASFREKMRLLTGPALVEALQGVEVFITEIDIVGAEALAKLPDLRVVAACRGDAVNVDVRACSAYGIPVVFAPGRNAVAVADLTLAFLLMLARRLGPASAFLRGEDVAAGDMGKMGKAFSQYRGHELGGLTIGLVGFGAVARRVASRLRGFDARLLIFDPYVDAETIAAEGGEKVQLDELLSASDLVSLHAAVTAETRGMIGAEELARMKAGAGLVNTARAALADEDALVAALDSEHLAGAALDTFAVEPPGFDHPILKHDSVIATPHVGGNTHEVAGHQGASIIAALTELLAGGRPQALLNPEILEDFDWAAPRATPDAATLEALAEAPPPAVTDLQRDARKKPGAATSGRAADPAVESVPDAPAPAAAPPAEVVDALGAVIDSLLVHLAQDEALATFAAERDVTLHFQLEDLPLEFYFRLHEGTVAGERRAPAESASVQLRMRAATLDGMLAGTLNAMEAAMQGEIAFTGDAGKAMTLQEMQDDLQRVYLRARDEAGPLPDLSVLTSAVASNASATPDADDLRSQIVATVNELYSSELITATGGNVSARIPERDEVWITPSQLFKGDLRPDVMVRLDFDGNSLDSGARSPSSEWSMHCAIFRARPEAKAVVHAHAPHATILANSGLPFLPISTEAAFFGDIPRVPFIMPGTFDLADAVAEAMRDSWAVLMVNHGLIVAGRSLRRAADMIEIIDRSAEVILGCYAVGKEPPTLPDDVIDTLRKMGDLVA